MPELVFDIREDGSSRVAIAVTGEIDMATAPELFECLCAHADRDVVVNLSGVGFLDSSGLGALVRGHKVLRAAGHVLHTTGERDIVLRVLEIAGLAGILHGENDT